MIKDKVRLNRLNQKALNEVAKEEAMYWRVRREALLAKLHGRGVPNIKNIDVSDSPLLSGELDKEIWRPENDDTRKRGCLHFYVFTIYLLIECNNDLSFSHKRSLT
jgi:hypothetical protein